MLSVKTTSIADRNVRAAAEIIDRTVGKKGDREVTARDVAKIERMLAKKELHGLHAAQLELLEQSLPRLKALLGDPATKPIAHDSWCKSLWITAIADREVHATAVAISKAINGGKEELALGTFLDARDAILGRSDGREPPPERAERVAAAKEKLADAVARGDIKPDAVRALDVLFDEGVGGILSWGPIRIGTRTLQDVYRLPTMNIREELLKDGKDPADVDWKKAYAPVIAEYEQRFAKLSYDRVYVVGAQGELLIGLNDSGRIEGDVAAGLRAVLKHDDNEQASGLVVYVKEVANSWPEATFWPWVDAAKKWTEVIGEMITSKTTKKVQDIIGRIIDSVSPSANKGQRVDLSNVSIAVTFASVLGTAAFSMPALGVVAGIGIGGTTAANIVSFLAKEKSKLPILHAMGVTVTRDDKYWY